jgi:transcriptional regulator with GAF, ATPase, and Fis domain
LLEDSLKVRTFESGKATSGFYADREHERGLKAHGHPPLTSRNRKLGVLSLARIEPKLCTDADLVLLSLIADQIAIAVDNAIAFREIAELKDGLAQEKIYLEDEISSEMNFHEIVGRRDFFMGHEVDIEWLGDTVIAASPPGTIMPLFKRDQLLRGRTNVKTI